ncbi:hypothetical protein Tco_0426860, partial [Tanacetum coccineum]
MGSGEGYGVAVECTRVSGLGVKPWGMGWYGFGGSGYGTEMVGK